MKTNFKKDGVETGDRCQEKRLWWRATDFGPLIRRRGSVLSAKNEKVLLSIDRGTGATSVASMSIKTFLSAWEPE